MSSSGNPAGGGDDTAGHGGLGMHGGGGRSADGNGTPATAGVCWALGTELESRKRKAAVVPTETDYLMGNEEDFNVSDEDSYRISKEIEDLRSQLALKKKELKCYQENKKLRVELALKVKVVECIRKENEELKAQNKDLRENIVEILDSQIESKKRHLQQSESWRTRLELSNAQLEEEIKNLYEGNTKETRCLMSHQTCSDVLNAILEVLPAPAASPSSCRPWRLRPSQEAAAAGASRLPSPAETREELKGLEKKVSEAVSNAEALRKTLDAEATEHTALRAVVTSVCDALEVGDDRFGSSLRSRLEVLYTRVGERVKDALHTGVKRALAVVSSHYLGIDLPAVSEGYVISDNEEEAQEEVRKLAAAVEAPGAALAAWFEPEVELPPLWG